MALYWGPQSRNRGPIYDPAERAYDWVAVDQPGADWGPRFLELYNYWRGLTRAESALGPRALPSRKAWDVLDVAKFMPSVRFFEVHPWSKPPGWRYRCRLVGTKQTEALGFDPTGQWMDEAEPWTWADERFIARQQAMLNDRTPTWRRGEIVFERSRDRGMLECLQMPFATDGETVDMVADFTLYSYAAN